MSVNHVSNELQELGEKFQSWHQNNPHQHIPKQLWDTALNLIEKYSLNNVAKSIGYPPSCLRQKLNKKSPAISTEACFVEVQLHQTNSDYFQLIQMNIQNHKGVVVELSFQGDLKLIYPLVLSLFQEKNL